MTIGFLKEALCRAYFQDDPVAIVHSFATYLHAVTNVWQPPFDPNEFARSLNLPVVRRTIEADGLLENWPADARVVLRAQSEFGGERERRRDRFTLAHEIGHFVIRERLTGWVEPHQFGVDDPEEEFLCNEFAGELLMPKNVLQPVIHDAMRPSCFIDAAEAFQVSLFAILTRAVKLNKRTLATVVWRRTGGRFRVEWSAPRRLQTAILCDTGGTSVERSFETNSEEVGRDMLMVEGVRQAWSCSSIRLNSDKVLMIGRRGVASTSATPETQLSSSLEPAFEILTRSPEDPPTLAIQLSLNFSGQPVLAAARRRLPRIRQ